MRLTRAEAIDLIRQCGSIASSTSDSRADFRTLCFARFKLLGRGWNTLISSPSVYSTPIICCRRPNSALINASFSSAMIGSRRFLSFKQFSASAHFQPHFHTAGKISLMPCSLSHCPLDLLHAFYDLCCRWSKLQLPSDQWAPLSQPAAGKPRE